MKILKSFLAAILLVVTHSARAQYPHLKLSDEHPTPDEKVMMTYDSTGSAAAGKPDLQATLFYFKANVQPSCINISLQQSGAAWKGRFVVPRDARAFFIKLYVKQDEQMMMHMEKEFDNNNDKGYVYLVYRDGQPVKGAYAAMSNIYWGDARLFSKIKPNYPEAFADLQKDITRYPDLLTEYHRNYYWLYTNVNRDKNRAAVLTVIDSLAANNNEPDNRLAESLYRQLRDTVKARQEMIHIQSAYPNGDQAKVDALTAIRKEKDVDKRLELYTAYRQRFAAQYPSNKDEGMLCESVLGAVAVAYSKKGQYTEGMQAADSIRHDLGRAAAYHAIAGVMAQAGQNGEKVSTLLLNSDELYKHMLADPESYNPYTETTEEFRRSLSQSLDENTDVRAMLLYKQGAYASAVKLEQPVYERLNKTYYNIDTHYAMMLTADGEPEKAMDVLAAVIKTGRAGEEQKAELKNAYVATHKTGLGYDEYLAGLNTDAKSAAATSLARAMLNEPTPQFVLKDLEGNAVSLASLKGKVVVVDFWATWCGPCKASFPGMQLAVNKYKDNPDVKFLFIDTWENGKPEAYLPAVKKFIADNHYTFQVLVDENDASGRQAKIVSDFKVDGIPTKFVIDKTGKIRFKAIGFSGTDQTVLEEVSTMVELAAKPYVAP